MHRGRKPHIWFRCACSALVSFSVTMVVGWVVAAPFAAGAHALSAKAVAVASTAAAHPKDAEDEAARTTTDHAVHTTAPLVTYSLSEDGNVPVRHLVATGETFSSILRERGLAATEIRSWEQAAAGVYRLGTMRPRHALILTFAKDQGRLTACEYEIDAQSMLSMRLVHGQIQARLKVIPELGAVRGIAGRVDASLATSATAAGVPVHMVSELAEVFGWEIDLDTDSRPGDQFRLLYEELHDEDGAVRTGDILAAEITSGGQHLTAIRFENDRGESEYYDVNGRALGRPFLKYPVDFVAITSPFSRSRLHPVLKRRRPHVGVDFAAPTGTPVRAVATGVVTFAGRNGQFGNHVDVVHDAPYASSYSHLQRIASGIRPGATVRKGEVIGYVGRTGLASGPHLHFMLFENGSYVNPLTAKLRVDEALTGARYSAFARVRADVMARLAALGDSVAMPALSLAPSLPDIVRSHVASRAD